MFLSYLKGRVQSVQIGSTFSLERANLLFGVPHCSVLGPLLFTIYTIPLGRIIQRHGLIYHLYADGTQLYMAFKPSDVTSKYDALSRIEACVADIRIWMNHNFLKLNDDKTELLIITTHEELSKISHISTKVGDQSISPSYDPPKWGVIFDSTCCLDTHFAKLCRNINLNLFSIAKIRKYLDRPTPENMINSPVTSRLDCCNSLSYGEKQSHIDRLQCCQDNGVIISKRHKFDHISPVLRELLQNSAPHLQGIEWPCSTISRSIDIKRCTTTAPPFGRSIYIQFTKMAAWNIWKASIRQGSPDPLEPSTPQREASSIYWHLQDQTWNLPVQ